MITVPNIGYVPFSSHSDASYIGKKAVTDLYKQMKEQNHILPTRSISSAANLTSLCVDISPSSSNFFEVLYIGKIKVWQRKVPDTFIDDALEKFRNHEQEKRKTGNGRRGSVDSTHYNNYNTISPHQQLIRSQSTITKLTVTNEDLDKLKSGSDGDINKNESTIKMAVDMDDHNRTMVLQVDRTDLRLISPDRKVILLHKHHREISTCVQGLESADHFGFISTDGNTQMFIGYIFKCESASVASDAVAAITQSFLTAEIKPKIALTSCEHCPMVWFHKLCQEIENLSDRKTQATILRRVEELDYEEQSAILTKFRSAETDSIRDQNEFLMMLLRAQCEMKQFRHVHDTAENRSEFLNQYLGGGGGTIFMKAKRSLTNSFELLKRKASKDDFGNTLTLPINREASPLSLSAPPSIAADTSDRESDDSRSSSGPNELAITTFGDTRALSTNSSTTEKGLKSPMMDIFWKVGSSPKTPTEQDSKLDSLSWRQAIFKRVMTPKTEEKVDVEKKRTKEELRELWKKAIRQAILLVRMEKENERLKTQQEESAVKRIKLEYDEMKPTQREVMDVWEMLTTKESRLRIDKQMLLHAIRQGVPRGKRGEVWQFLSEQYCSKVAPMDTSKFPNYNVPYETLLKQLTSHQHAILIDLGRTFPNHSYFSSPLGPGQLALFNLLKAYSLLDHEMGYCQGLSFVAGVLLLHMEESQAFFLLRHLMFRRGLRKQYLPDMVGLQVKLYQLSRLLHDQIPELYDHFDLHDVSPTLYAAPWLLTIFASQFPLGFVTRVFDLIFLESPDVIFRVAIALLTYHKDNLLKCDSFEEIMNYLKNALPAIDKPTLDKIMKDVFTTDITKQLNEYLVEYQVLQEEMTSIQPQVETLHKLEHENKILNEANKALTAQLELALSNVQRLEKTRTLQQSQLNRLEMQSRGLDVTIATLGNFINNLIDERKDIEIPDEVRRIISQYNLTERRKSDLKPNLMKMFQQQLPEKVMTKSLSTGKLPLNQISEQLSRSNSLNTNNNQPPKTKFFSSSYNHIMQRQQQQQQPEQQQQQQQQQQRQQPQKIDIKIQDYCEEEEDVENVKTITNKKDDISPSNSIDSGVGTPSSPKNLESDLIRHHPLSNCDVNFCYNGTQELKHIKSGRCSPSRQCSPDFK